MQIQAVIDRFESSKAILLVGDDEAQVVWPRHILPSEAQEGDILQLMVQVDCEATIAAKTEAAKLLQEIMQKNQEG